MIPTYAYNLATKNKWLLVMPFKKIDSSLTSENVCFNLSKLQLPELSLGTTSFNFQGVQFPLPTFVRNESKQLVFNYMLSSDWHQYKLLYKWWSMISQEQGGSSTNITSDLLLDIHVFFLSEFKNILFNIKYVGCQLTNIGSLDLNYQTDGENIEHNFTLNYGYYEVQNLL